MRHCGSDHRRCLIAGREVVGQLPDQPRKLVVRRPLIDDVARRIVTNPDWAGAPKPGTGVQGVLGHHEVQATKQLRRAFEVLVLGQLEHIRSSLVDSPIPRSSPRCWRQLAPRPQSPQAHPPPTRHSPRCCSSLGSRGHQVHASPDPPIVGAAQPETGACDATRRSFRAPRPPRRRPIERCEQAKDRSQRTAASRPRRESQSCRATAGGTPAARYPGIATIATAAAVTSARLPSAIRTPKE